ncbi:hypothetical protein LSH36_4g13001 [Paralvinella palmiformis]|uniref:Ankyrin repeat protein n=1 Tax=Paralvinella palmiformis TaxID=53620 RepID=A0AAD9NJ30_9ANNE|nr:hypothetical protein LSH36_4g13001 [Paralvinella palmiformis]
MAGEMWQLQKTLLGKAIMEGNPKLVKRLISKGEDVFMMDRKGNTYVHYVCTMYRPYVINILLAAGVPINVQNKFGNTALHVTALHSECCNVPDLMQCGINPYIENKDGKTAANLASNNPRWLDLHAKYEPTLRVAIENHDFETINYLFGCWCAVHLPIDIQGNHDMRQYAAGLTYHDIVAMIDKIRFTLMAVYSIKECNHKRLKYALSRGRAICNVNFLQQVRGGHCHHMLQHAIRLKDYKMVHMLLEAGADVNIPVHIQEYIMGPLYFEVMRKDGDIDMKLINLVFAKDIDLKARDERGRSALVYCIDRRDEEVTIEIINMLLEKGINVAMRDNTGCTARDVALFARRHDIVAAIDQQIVDKIRSSDFSSLHQLAMENYRDIFINYLGRDTWIFAAGNDTDDIRDYLKEILDYWKIVESLHQHIISGDKDEVCKILKTYPDRDMLLRSRDKGGRGPLLLAVLFNRYEIASHIHNMDNTLAAEELDNKEYGMKREVHCMNKFHPEGHPLVIGYRDLLHSAVNHHKEDMAIILVRCKLNCSIRQKYKTSDGDRWMTAEERAEYLGLHKLAKYIVVNGVHAEMS